MTETWTVPSTDGVEIAIHELGGDGPALLISHATGFCGRMYEPLAAHLTDSYRVVAFDYRGHGESSTPSTDLFSWRRMVTDLFAVVDTIGSPSPIKVVGHSMGGGMSMLGEHLRPGTFSGAYLFEPVVIPTGFTDGPNGMARAAAARKSTFASRAEVMWRYAQRAPMNEMRTDTLAAYINHGFVDLPDGTVTLRCHPSSEAATFRCTEAVSPKELADVHIPVTIAAGRVEESHGPGEWAEMISEALPQGRCERFHHVGHFGPFEDPFTIADSIKSTFAAADSFGAET
jgi:pimeloyl-ACP methyl ester carboxylesterase